MSDNSILFQEPEGLWVSRVSDLERAFLKDFIRVLESIDPRNDEEFSRVLSVALKRCEISQKEFAEEFHVSKSTISRWRRGNSVPHRMVRTGILDWIKQKVIRDFVSVSEKGGLESIKCNRAS